MGLRTLLAALQSSDRVSPDSIGGPFQMSAGDEVPVVCFQFRMSHFTCKAYLAHGTQDEGGSQHLKLQTVFDDNRRSLGEEQRYFVANEWNATKRYTRLKCGSGGSGRNSSFTLEYDVLCPSEMPHSWGLLLLSQTLRMWYTSMVACVMHIVEPRDMPFATHDMITANTLAMTVREEDTGLQREACPICFEKFCVGEKVRRLPCMHLFHVVGEETDSDQGRHCNIDRHLTRDKQCPVCKTPIDIMERVDKNPAKSGEPSAGASGSGAVEAVGADSPPAAAAAEGEAASAAPRPSAATAEAPAAAEVAGLPTTAAVTALATAAQAVAAAAAAADQAATIASSNGAMAVAAAAGARRTGSADGGADAAESGEGPAGGEGGDRPPQADAAEQAAEQAQQQRPSDTRALGAAAATGLPAQAVELERAVRSLQSRWLQIQDVVAGMQQMLQYIEESQSALSLARQAADGNGSGGQGADGGPASAAAATAAAAANAASAAAAVVATAAAGVAAPAPRGGAGEAAAEAAAEAADADAGQGGEAPGVETAEEEPSQGDRQQPPPEDQQGAEVAAAAGLREPVGGEVEGEAAASDDPEPQARAGASAPAVQQAPVQVPALRAPAAPAASPAEAPAQAAAEPAAPLSSPPTVQRPRERWVPFTETEKVCMAYMWRQRRAAMLAGALAGAMAPERL